MTARTLGLTPRRSDARRTLRSAVNVEGEIREQGGYRLTVRVVDLSVTGFRCETGSPPSVGARVFLRLPGFGGFESMVKWRNDNGYGCAFVQPLHASVRDLLVTRHGQRD